MIYILIDDENWKKRCSGEIINTENIAVELLRNDVKCKIISQKIFMDMVDNYVYPSDGDKIYFKTLNLDILNAARKLEARGFILVNGYETLRLLRDFQLLNKKLLENKIPTVFLHDQIFSKYNLDRTRAFGQNFNDFLVEYVKEYDIQSFYLRSKSFNLWYKLNKQNSYTEHNISDEYLWMICECPPVSLYTRSRVVGGKCVKGSTISTSRVGWTEFSLYEDDRVTELVNTTAKTIGLEIGSVDLVLDSTNELRVFSVFENGSDRSNIHYKQIAKYLLK